MERKKHVYTEEEAYQKLSAQCALSELCCHDVMAKMGRWDMLQAVAERVAERLVKERFIDEKRFARAFVRDKFRYNHWGSVKIKQELKRRNIAEQHITEALNEIEEQDHLAALHTMIEKKRLSVKGRNEYEIRGKLIRFALGRGFPMDDIVRVVGSLDVADSE